MLHAKHGTPWRRIATSVALGLALLTGTANAAPVTYDFVAEISLLSDLNGGTANGLALGDTVTGSLTYEADAPLNFAGSLTRQDLIDNGLTPVLVNDPPPPPGTSTFAGEMADSVSDTYQTIGGPGFGGTDPVFEISFDFGAFQSSVGGDSLIRHRSNEYVPTPDRPTFAYDTLFMLADIGNFSSGIRFMDTGVYTGTFPNDRTLLSLPSLDDMFRTRVFATLDVDGDGVADTQVFAVVTELSRVPAPGALVLLLLGLIGLRVGARRA